MKMQSVIPAWSAALVLFTYAIETTTGLDLTPRNSHKDLTSCNTNSGESGKCVDWSYCNENFEIEKGGIISDSELRVRECPRKEEWCCSDKNINTSLASYRMGDSSSSCIVTDKADCPWCVKLYRDGKDRRRRESGFFCMGTLIGTKAILTTGTCVHQAGNQNMWARIPSSPNPNANYTVNFKLLHPEYNSGTRENDLALLSVNPEPEWDQSGRKGACLRLEPNSLVGECIAAGVDDDENIHMTPLIVTEGNCGRGAVFDSSCGHAIGEDCSIYAGSPIMCRQSDGSFMMTGLAKLPCINDPPQSLLNNLAQAGQWLNDRLKGIMGLMEKDYLKLNTT